MAEGVVNKGKISMFRFWDMLTIVINVRVDSTVYAQTIATLPEGYRPYHNVVFPVSTSDTKCGYAEVDTNGSFHIFTPGLTGFLSASITCLAAQT
jgi:hypothetical protein